MEKSTGRAINAGKGKEGIKTIFKRRFVRENEGINWHFFKIHTCESHQNRSGAGVKGQVFMLAFLLMFVVVVFNEMIVQEFLKANFLASHFGLLAVQLVMLLQILQPQQLAEIRAGDEAAQQEVEG